MEENHAAQTQEKKISVLNIPAFWRAQKTDWKVTVVRTSLERLGYQMIYPYLSVFIIALGAEATQLGAFTSAGMILAGLLGPLTGHLIDTKGPKIVYLVGIALLFTSYILYGSSAVWPIAAVATIVYYIGQGVGSHSCATICGNCLRNKDRAKGMLICESLAAGVLGMIGPAFSGWVLVNIMHAGETPGAADIRPLFFLSGTITLTSFLVVAFKLSKTKPAFRVRNKHANVLRDAVLLLKSDKITVKWLIIAAIQGLPNGMILPYVQLYAAEVKHADAATLAGIVTATALTSVLFGYPFGVLSDKIGHKRILFITTPLLMAANVLLLFADTPFLLILVGVLLGFFQIGSALSGTVSRELVPARIMGRWTGVNKLVTSLVSALMAAVSGAIYYYVGPHFVFIIYVAAEALIRLPLLATLPETLRYKPDESKFQSIE